MDKLVRLWESGERRPQTLDEEPDLFDDVQPVWDAFAVLNRSRLGGFAGAEPIQFSELAAYHDRFPYHWGSVEFFFGAIQELDRMLLDHVRRKAEQRQKARKSKTTPRSGGAGKRAIRKR